MRKQRLEEARKSKAVRWLWVTWEASVIASFPAQDEQDNPLRNVPPWTGEDRKRLGGLSKFWQGSTEDLHEFLEYVVFNWTRIIANRFGWMRKDRPPYLPSIRFVLAFRDKFMDEYVQRKVEDWLSSEEISQLERLRIQSGMTREQAIMHLAEQRAANRLRAETAKGKAEAERLLRAAELAKAAATKQMERAIIERGRELQRVARPKEEPKKRGMPKKYALEFEQRIGHYDPSLGRRYRNRDKQD